MVIFHVFLWLFTVIFLFLHWGTLCLHCSSSDSESMAALGFVESWGPASRSNRRTWAQQQPALSALILNILECLRSGRRNTSEKKGSNGPIRSTPKEVIGALSLSLWSLSLSLKCFDQKRKTYLTSHWLSSWFVASDAVRFSGIGASLMIFLHGTCCAQTTNETQRIGISVFSDLQARIAGHHNTSGHIIRPLHWIWGLWGLRWEAFRNCTLEKVPKMPQSCLEKGTPAFHWHILGSHMANQGESKTELPKLKQNRPDTTWVHLYVNGFVWKCWVYSQL